MVVLKKFGALGRLSRCGLGIVEQRKMSAVAGRVFWGAVDLLKRAAGWFGGLGLFQRRARILLVGLDASGKTTLLQVLKRDIVQAHEPTQHPQAEEVTLHNVRFHAVDLGGHAAARLLWRRYVAGMDGLVFLVDAADPKRFEEARAELARLMDSAECANAPILVLGNKVDAPGAVSRPQLRDALGLGLHLAAADAPADEKAADERAPGGNGRPVELFMCSVVRRWGYDQAFAWLSRNLPSPS